MLTLGFREIPQLLEGGQERGSETIALPHSRILLKHTAEGWRCLQVTPVIYCFDSLGLAGGSEPLTSCSRPGEQHLCEGIPCSPPHSCLWDWPLNH